MDLVKAITFGADGGVPSFEIEVAIEQRCAGIGGGPIVDLVIAWCAVHLNDAVVRIGIELDQ